MNSITLTLSSGLDQTLKASGSRFVIETDTAITLTDVIESERLDFSKVKQSKLMAFHNGKQIKPGTDWNSVMVEPGDKIRLLLMSYGG